MRTSALMWSVVLGLIAMPAAARALPAAQLDGTQAGLKLGHHASLLVDDSGELTIDDVAQGPAAARFEPIDQDAPSLGFSQATAWMRIRVDNVLAEEQLWWLESAYPHVDVLRLYVPGPDGGFEVRTAGDMLPFDAREVPYRNPVFRLSQPPGETVYYIEASTSGSLTLPLRAWTPDTFTAHLNAEQPMLWMFYGVLLAISLYNLFIFFSVRSTAYLLYVMYSLSYALFQFILNGLAFQYLWPNSVWWANQCLPSAIALGFVTGVQFYRRFLDFDRLRPRADRVVRLLTYLHGVAVLGCLFVPYAVGIRVVVVLGLVVIPITYYNCIVLSLRGHRPATFYLVAWTILSLGIFLYLLKTMNLLPSNFLTEWVIQIGASLEMILLSLGLADRINVMRRDLEVLNGKLTQNVSELEVALKRAEEARRAKSEFLAGVSHELRTPLNTIINVPQGLLEDFHKLEAVRCRSCESQFEREPEDVIDDGTECPECATRGQLVEETLQRYTGTPARSIKYLDQVIRSGSHLLEVINDILDISRLEAGKTKVEAAEVDMAALFESRIAPMAGLADRMGVLLRIEPLPSPCIVFGDQVKLGQVFINLVGNAIKFSDGRGAVDVRTWREGDDFLFSIIDRGVGIAEADQARIFESFVQAEGGQTRRFGGSGLGLAITKELVVLHGGTIEVESKLGEGSTFTVRLPAHDAGSAADPRPATRVSPSQQPPAGDAP